MTNAFLISRHVQRITRCLLWYKLPIRISQRIRASIVATYLASERNMENSRAPRTGLEELRRPQMTAYWMLPTSNSGQRPTRLLVLLPTGPATISNHDERELICYSVCFVLNWERASQANWTAAANWTEPSTPGRTMVGLVDRGGFVNRHLTHPATSATTPICGGLHVSVHLRMETRYDISE
jgi:hypothetical protein